MAYSDHKLIDETKQQLGDSDMTDEQMQDAVDAWLVTATPEQRQKGLDKIRDALYEEDTSSQLSKKVILLQLERRYVAVDKNLKRFGR